MKKLIDAGAIIRAGDVIVADDDGVCVVPRRSAEATLKLCEERERKEAKTRERLKAGELGLDIYSMREKLAQRGLVYRDEPPED
jgi:4-hydroxy-4-methyl-2-oxoglutarate aldolase